MGLIHAPYLQKVVSDAELALAQGDVSFCVAFDVNTRGGVSMRKIRKEIDVIVRAVEPIGWGCYEVRPFFASVEMNVVRTSW